MKQWVAAAEVSTDSAGVTGTFSDSFSDDAMPAIISSVKGDAGSGTMLSIVSGSEGTESTSWNDKGNCSNNAEFNCPCNCRCDGISNKKIVGTREAA
mmetsp:Transcript_24816/g.31838  ORF Transcript_24816/g.31838 Transcript_24816/m.31838 type:complete len:97 (+) Transcript_24816:69-359(+)